MKTGIKILLLFPIISALLAAGIFLPDAVFSLSDRRELTRTAANPIDAMNLQLSNENNLYRRMEMLSKPPTMKQSGKELTTRTVQEISYEVQNFLKTSSIYILEDENLKFLGMEPILYTNTDMQLSAVFWETELEITVSEDFAYSMYLVVDDITKNIIGLRYDVLIDPHPYAQLDTTYGHTYMSTLRRSFGMDQTALVDNRDEYVIIKNRWYGSTCYYVQSTLHINNEGKQYRFLCHSEKNCFIFNLPEGMEMKEKWENKYEAVEEERVESIGMEKIYP